VRDAHAALVGRRRRRRKEEAAGQRGLVHGRQHGFSGTTKQQKLTKIDMALKPTVAFDMIRI
jgi:hypothetical protein